MYNGLIEMNVKVMQKNLFEALSMISIEELERSQEI